MKALVLTAGCSRRLRPLTNHTPKSLRSVGGMPILRRSLRTLQEFGFEEFVIVTGYLSHRIVDAVSVWFPEISVQYIDNPDYATTNNAYSLYAARHALDGEAFFLLDGDIIYDADVLTSLIAHGEDCLALRSQGDIGLEEVKVRTGDDNRILEIGKAVAVPSAAGESIGIQYFSGATSAALFQTLQDRVIDGGEVNEYYEASFQQMLDEGIVLHAIDIEDSYAIEIDTVEDLAAANRTLLARRSLTMSRAG